jgi:SAM-dependent methyltransferase
MTSTGVREPGTEYLFDNDSGPADQHHRGLSKLLDPISAARIGRLLPVLSGKRCLEVGYGGGTFALWLTSSVGRAGRVLATDLKPLPLPAMDALEVLSHNVVTEPIPDAGTWDLIHARLLLNHLRDRRAVLAKLAAALAPGGLLVTEDWQSATPDRFVAYAPTEGAWQALRAFHAATLAVLDEHGNDRDWATDAHATMRQAGLINVYTETSGETWTGGDDGTRLLLGTSVQVRDEMAATGLISEAQLDELPELLMDPDVAIHGHRLYTTSGWRPS